MARIVVIAHAYDDFENQNYLLQTLVRHWIANGHRVSLRNGIADLPDADIAVLHTDLSLTPPEYVDACGRYPVVVNGAVTDIRKTRISRHLLRPDDGWTGPVIVKTDLNSGGIPELRTRHLSQLQGQQADLSARIVVTDRPYPILRSAADVTEAIWSNPGLVVERFLPEREAEEFCVRAWVFCGNRERCTRYRSASPIVKTGNMGTRESVPVPDELRAERKRLRFDYGKFDFVVRGGEVVLFDVNRTPGAPPPPLTDEVEKSNADLARGIEDMLSS